MKIGYARVSTTDQKLRSQIDALTKEGCKQVFEEKMSGAKKERRELDRCLELLREGDTLVVTKLDRLGRTVKQLVELIETFKTRGIHFKCLDDPIDTTSSTGTFFFHVMGAFAELEKNLIRERTSVGLSAARKRGRTGGRPETISRVSRKGGETASRSELIGFFEHLERELDTCGFLFPVEKRSRMVRNLRNIYTRAGLTDQEVKTLRGVVTGLSSRRNAIK